MPNCFTLTKKGESKPSLLTEVDEAICNHLGVDVDPVVYVHNWYDTIGLGLALGRDWNSLREVFPHKSNIIDFLEANYTPDCWAEIGNRR